MKLSGAGLPPKVGQNGRPPRNKREAPAKRDDSLKEAQNEHKEANKKESLKPFNLVFLKKTSKKAQNSTEKADTDKPNGDVE